jgi:hypothetical protein
MILKAPFPWFGGKSRVAHVVWERFGDVPNYVEPFAGSLAVPLARPHAPKIETVNDKDAYLANFWRAVQADPEAVAYHANWPVNEADLKARHLWLVNEGRPLVERCMDDPEYFDARIAGWWVWGISCWIGGGWCTTQRANQRRLPEMQGGGKGINRQSVWASKPHVSTAGTGVHAPTIGVHAKRPKLMNEGSGVHTLALRGEQLTAYMEALRDRLRFVRVCCGDWQRVVKPSVTITNGLTGVLLDPPYSEAAGRDMDCYGVEDGHVAHAVREWALANGGNPQLRIALCGYAGEHDVLEQHGWRVHEWTTGPGYSVLAKQAQRGKDNRKRERIWFSPHCLVTQPSLFDTHPLPLMEENA